MKDDVNGTGAQLTLLSLATLGKGAAIELFEHELARVLENVMDPNTEAKAKRSIRLDITIEPNEDRNAATITVDPSCKLAPFKGDASVVYIGRKHGKPVATTYDMEQTQLGWDADAAPKALPVAPPKTATGTGD